MDNYHASVTKAGIVSYKKGEKVIEPWTDESAFAKTVDEYCIEARDRFNAGDVATGRQPASPETVKTRELVAAMNALVGEDLIDAVDVAELIRERDHQVRARLGKDPQVVAVAAQSDVASLNRQLVSGDQVMVARRGWFRANSPALVGAAASVVVAVFTALLLR